MFGARQAGRIVCEVCTCKIVVRKLDAHLSPAFDAMARMRFGESPQVPRRAIARIDPSSAADVSANAFLKKPLDFDRLLQLVRTYCR